MKEITIENLNYSNVKNWIKEFDHKQKVEFAVYCAELVIDLYAGSSDSPKKAIQAAKDWLLNPSNENKNKCRAAAYAAYAADDAAAAASAADAAAADAAYAAYAAADDAAAYAAYAAADDATAYAAAATAAADAAYAAYAAAYAAADTADASAAAYAYAVAKNTNKEKIVNYIKSKLEKPRTKEVYEKIECGELYLIYAEHVEPMYGVIETEFTPIQAMDRGNVYRKVTKSIEWWESAADFISNISGDDKVEVEMFGKGLNKENAQTAAMLMLDESHAMEILENKYGAGVIGKIAILLEQGE